LLAVRRDPESYFHRIFTVASDSVAINGLTITNGIADVGGGIYNQGTLLLNDVVISTNYSTSGFGGGIYNGGTLEMNGSAVNNNSSSNMGGGIFNVGTFEMHGSAVIGNRAERQSMPAAKGGGIYNAGTMTITDSTISDNWCTGQGAWGGGIHNAESVNLVVENSTIAQNHVTPYGGGNKSLKGGGIYTHPTAANLTIHHATITANEVGSGGSGGLSQGGGVWGHVSLMRNSILSGNTAQNGPDILGEISTSEHNFVGGNALLGLLQDNGGPTQTIALLPGSPAIDAGDPNPDDPPEFDQRGPGFPRIVNGRIDIGAFEVQATGAPPANDLTTLITADLEAISTKRRK
jgi:hypothetical protein